MTHSISWMNRSDYEKQSYYLFSSYSRIERDFLELFDYIPLREDYLCIESSWLADYILRVTPLLSKAFRLLTFGPPYKSIISIHEYLKSHNEKKQKILQELSKLYEKKEKNRDYIRDYFNFYNHKEMGSPFLFAQGRISSVYIKLFEIPSEIEYDEVLKPFTSKNFNSWLEYRNEVEHRDRTQATIEKSLQGIACLFILIRKISEYTYENVESDLFKNIF